MGTVYTGPAVKARPEPTITYRVWREAEQRWYTQAQLRRKAALDRFKKIFTLRRGENENG